MSRLRRHRAAALALLCAALGAVLVLLALDVRSWQRTIARDDVRFRALPSHAGLWRPPTALPGDPASALLGTGDTVALRRALQLFWSSRIGVPPEARRDIPILRAAAQAQLEALMTTGHDAPARSLAANLLGVLVVTTSLSQSDAEAQAQILRRAAGYFQRAVALDAGNVEAKLNLELVLRLRRPGGGPSSKDARSGYGFAPGRSIAPAGSGY